MASHGAAVCRVRVPGHAVRHRHLRHGGGAGGGRDTQEVQVSQETNSQKAWRDPLSANLPVLPVEVGDDDGGVAVVVVFLKLSSLQGIPQ